MGDRNKLKDLLQGKGLDDMLFDYRNNQIGIRIGNKFRDLNQKSLFDYIFKTEIEPYRGYNG